MRRFSDPCTVRSALVVIVCLLFGFSVFDSQGWREIAIRWSQDSAALNSSSFPEELQLESPPPSHHVILAFPGDSANEQSVASPPSASPEKKDGMGGKAGGDAVEVAKHKDETRGPTLAPQEEQTDHRERIPIAEVIGVPIAAPYQDGSFQPNFAPTVVSSVLSPAGPPKELTSIQKIELSLSKARAAIRQALKAGKRKKAGEGDYVPDGDAYRNAAFFHQTYSEMEKRFKIYAYEEGEEPLVHNGPCKEIYAVEGRFIQELQGDNPFLTTDPGKAHVFFLPFSVAMMVTYLYRSESHDYTPLERFVKDYVHVITQRHPFWNRSSGADHFMLTCHDWGPHISKVHKELEENAIRVICNANLSEGYVATKDVSLPEINLIGGSLAAELGGPSVEERNYLAFFSGAEHGPVRPLVFEHWEGKDEDVQVFRSHSFPKDKSYHDYMKHSKFCLCPGGYEVNSPRLVEAIYNDCVPVIIADNFILPFSDVLNWKAFSFHIAEQDIPNLKEILQKVSPDQYRAMQDNVRRVQRHFLFNQPPQRYDVFHMILHSVWLRRLNVQIRST